MAVISPPGFDLQPSGQQVALATNYINNFNFITHCRIFLFKLVSKFVNGGLTH